MEEIKFSTRGDIGSANIVYIYDVCGQGRVQVSDEGRCWKLLTLSADKTYVDKLSFPWPRKKSSSRQGEILGVLTLPGDKIYVDKGNLLKKVLKAIKDLVTHANIECLATGFSLQAMNSRTIDAIG